MPLETTAIYYWGMRIAPFMLVSLALAGCNSGGSPAGEIVGHRWAHALADCGDTYLDFSQDMIAFVRDGKPVNALSVRRIVNDSPGPSMATFVIEDNGALAAKPVAPPDTADITMVFRVDGDSLKLVGQGAGERLKWGMPGAKNYSGFVLRRCPER